METRTSCAYHVNYNVAMNYFEGNSFDNQDVLTLRFSIVLIEKGSGIASLNGYYIPYIAPCVFCINENEHFIIQESNQSHVRGVLFHPSVINSFLNFHNLQEEFSEALQTISQDQVLFNVLEVRDRGYIGKIDIGPVTEKKIVILLDGIREMSKKQSAENCSRRSRSQLMQLLFLLDNLYSLKLSPQQVYMEDIEDNFYPILLYIYQNYKKKITIMDMTERFYISKASLAKMFRKNLGDSFLSYLNRLRTSMAATMLRDTCLPINEIMVQVGFTDSVHFLRTFKKYTGLSPSAYRNKFCSI